MAPWKNADDFIIRISTQLGAALNRILRLRASNEPTTAWQEIDSAIETLLGPRAGVIDAVDAATAAQLLDDPRAIIWYARFLFERAELLDQGSNEEQSKRAAAIKSRVATLTREARQRGAPSHGDLYDLLRELERRCKLTE